MRQVYISCELIFFAFDTLSMADFCVLCDSLFVARGHVMAI